MAQAAPRVGTACAWVRLDCALMRARRLTIPPSTAPDSPKEPVSGTADDAVLARGADAWCRHHGPRLAGDLETRHAAHQRRRTEARVKRRETHVGAPAQQGDQRHLKFLPGERVANAVMGSTAE